MVDPCTFILFGATGDLSKKKLMPALYHLEEVGRLPNDMAIIGVDLKEMSHEEWVTEVKGMLEKHARKGLNQKLFEERFQKRLHYRGHLTGLEEYQKMRKWLHDTQVFHVNENKQKNIIFQLSIPPSQFSHVVTLLSQAELLKEEGCWRRVVIEKPFGYDLESARQLNEEISQYLTEKQTYRIDHYLGKGTVQNILVFRFANVMLEPIWNNKYIDHVQIIHGETGGTGGRAGYYDAAGAMRDMIQNHLLQLLALVAMEKPKELNAEALRDAKVTALKSIRPILPTDTVQAQYREGVVEGQVAKSYLTELADETKQVKKSKTETYAAMKLFIDNKRWEGVPFYLRTGKRMAKKQSMIAICFKNNLEQLSLLESKSNWVIVGIDPESLIMEMTLKEPGLGIGLESVVRTHQRNLMAHFREVGDVLKDAYDDLLLDVLEGEQSLFLRKDEVEAAWQVVDPILKDWEEKRTVLDYCIPTYPAGSWEPDEMLKPPKTGWRHTTIHGTGMS